MTEPATTITLAEALNMVSTTPEGAAIFLHKLVNLFGDASTLGVEFKAVADTFPAPPEVPLP